MNRSITRAATGADDVNPRSGVTLGVGVHSALTARLAEAAGFEALWLGSLELSTSLGLPDLNLIGTADVSAILRQVRAVSGLPIYVDADNGYGSDLTAIRAAREFEASGATAICIEDNQFPKRNSLLETGQARALEEPKTFARRIAKVKAECSKLHVIARTEALVSGLGIDDAVMRLQTYSDAGADALFVQVNGDSANLLLPVLEKVHHLRPLVLAPTALPTLCADDLAPFGQVTMLFANVMVRAIAAVTSDILSELIRARSLASVEPRLQTISGLFDLVSTHEWLNK